MKSSKVFYLYPVLSSAFEHIIVFPVLLIGFSYIMVVIGGDYWYPQFFGEGKQFLVDILLRRDIDVSLEFQVETFVAKDLRKLYCPFFSSFFIVLHNWFGHIH